MKVSMRVILLLAALLSAACTEAPAKKPAGAAGAAETKESPPAGSGGESASAAMATAATGDYAAFENRSKKFPLSKSFAEHIAALVKTKPSTPSGPQPNALPRGIITVNGKSYTFFGSLWQDDKEYWKSPQLEEFWKFLNEHPAGEIPSFEPSAVKKP